MTSPGTFPDEDIVFTARSSVDEKTGLARVELGARVAGEVPVFPITFSLGPHPMRDKTPPTDPQLTGAERREAKDETTRRLHRGEQARTADPHALKVRRADVSRVLCC
mgnify:CR=1 FL=1